MHLRALGLLFLLLMTEAASAASVGVPEPLNDWQDWVLQGEEFRQCPFFALGNPADPAQHACALPGTLAIRIAGGKAEIGVGYRVYVPGYVGLVHAARTAPEALSVDGQSAKDRNSKATFRAAYAADSCRQGSGKRASQSLANDVLRF